MKGRSKVHASASTLEPMTSTLTGAATASGDNTRVTGSLTGAATDDGLVSVTTGEAVFTATAQSPTGEVTAATADTSRQLRGGSTADEHLVVLGDSRQRRLDHNHGHLHNVPGRSG